MKRTFGRACLSSVILVPTLVVSLHSLPRAIAAPAVTAASDQIQTPTTPEVSPDRLVVTTEPGVNLAEQQELASDAAANIVRRVDGDTFAIKVDANNKEHVEQMLETMPGVVKVEDDHIYRIAATPNDVCFAGCTLSGGGGSVNISQWYLSQTDAPDAWDITKGSAGISVAVLDTGVSTTHPDLSGKIIYGPHYATSSDNDVLGHGSHVAGIIAANTNNTTGIAGLGWNTKVLSIKVLNDSGAGTASNIAAGIHYAVDNGARVINMSLAGTHDNTLHDAVEYALGNDVVVVAAAGNDNKATKSYPAGYSGVIAVGATDDDDDLTNFSNYGRWVDVVAPGQDIVSTFHGTTYQIEDGTSMAAPQVAATAALMLAKKPTLTNKLIGQYISRAADKVSGTGDDFRWGRLNVARSLKMPTDGFWLSATDGGMFTFGERKFYGSTGNISLNKPIVAMSPTANAKGYWLAASDGGIFSFGNAKFKGSTGGIKLNKPIVTMATTPTGNGYWLVATDGGVFSFGDAKFYGSTGGIKLNKPIVGMAPTKTGKGYWMVASDGGIFSFGDAKFKGSTGGINLTQPIVAIEASKTGKGYWMVSKDGGIYAFGDAGFYGSGAGSHTNVIGMRKASTGDGYWIVTSDGYVYGYGRSYEYGDLRKISLAKPIVAIGNVLAAS